MSGSPRRRGIGRERRVSAWQTPVDRDSGPVKALAAYVAVGGSVPEAARRVGSRPRTVKRHLADLRARSGLTTEQLIYVATAAGRLVVPSLEPH